MGEWARQVRTELRQLPLILGKVLGGIAAVIGFTTLVLIVTRTSGASPGNIVPPLLIGGAGMAVFVLFGRALARRSSITEQACPRADRVRMNIFSWALLLLFALIFMVAIWLMIR